MCGILGARKTLCPDRVRAGDALEALRWRGRDAQRLVDAGALWMGVARLRISDLGADQPIVCPRTERIVALNGALTSAQAVWPRYLGKSRTRNDAELLLLALEDRGAVGLTGFTGPYAFAIADSRTGELWLGRDPEGEKPLWVLTDERGAIHAFASTRSALRIVAGSLGGRWEGPGPDAVARTLRFGLVLEEDWVFRCRGFTARLLPPGVWHARPGEPPTAVDVAPSRASFGGLDLEVALRRAASRCATAEVPVGLALSGGIDSACLAACLSDQKQDDGPDRPLPTAYHARGPSEDDGETQRARAVASRFGYRLVEVGIDVDAFDALPGLVRAHGMPLPDPSVVAVHALARRVAADGTRVLLSGEGADELLLGYPRHRAAARIPGLRIPLPGPRLSMRRRARAWRALTSRPAYDALLEVAPPGFVAAVSTARRAPGITDAVAGGAPTCLEAARRVDRIAYLRGDLLPKLDVATLAAGVEGRCPFLDPEVTGSIQACDPDGRRILGKRTLRERFATLLPDGHFDQPKRGFASPVDRALRGDGVLVDLLVDQRTLARDHVKRDGVRRMLDLHRSGQLDLGHPLYVLAALELALRAHDDTDAPAESAE